MLFPLIRLEEEKKLNMGFLKRNNVDRKCWKEMEWSGTHFQFNAILFFNYK